MNKFAISTTAAVSILIMGCSRKPPQTISLPEPPRVEESESADEGRTTQGMGDQWQQAWEELQAALRPVYFDYDQATLRSESKETLARVGEVMLRYPLLKSVTIEGHADERGTDEYNFALGERRAQAIRKYLTDFGVGSDRLVTVSFGEEKPAVLESTEEGWAKNRRGEFQSSN